MVMLDRGTNEYREMDQQTLNQVSQQLTGAMAQMQAQLQNLPPEQRARIAGPGHDAGAVIPMDPSQEGR